MLDAAAEFFEQGAGQCDGGIAAADKERVFAPFVRLETSRSRETGGTGLGLTITRNAIRSMGGDIELINRVEGGLRARVTLPATTA